MFNPIENPSSAAETEQSQNEIDLARFRDARPHIVLGITKEASFAEAKDARRKLLQELGHGRDVGGETSEAIRLMLEAYARFTGKEGGSSEVVEEEEEFFSEKERKSDDVLVEEAANIIMQVTSSEPSTKNLKDFCRKERIGIDFVLVVVQKRPDVMEHLTNCAVSLIVDAPENNKYPKGDPRPYLDFVTAWHLNIGNLVFENEKVKDFLTSKNVNVLNSREISLWLQGI